MEIEPIGDAPVQARQAGPISQQPGVAGVAPPPTPDLGNTPVEAANTAGGAVSTLTGVNPALATTVAKAISLGLVQAPTSQAGWAKIIDKFETTGGQNEVTMAEKAQGSGTPATTQQPGAAGSSAPFTQGGSQAQWAATVLTRAGVPVTQNNVDNFMRWMTAEEPSTDWAHANNPLNINAGGTGFDSFGSLDQSASATAAVLKQPNMKGILGALASNADINGFSAAVVASPWAASHYGGDPNHLASIPLPSGQVPAGNAQPSSIASGVGVASNNVVRIAQSQIGVRYVWGGEAAGKAFDCSGLVQWVYGQAGDKLPRVAQAQYDATPKIATGAQLQPGDLLFFGSGPKGVEHVGIYIGNGQMIDAPHTGADVRVDQVFNPQNGAPMWGNYVGATRPADPTGTTTAAPNSPVQQTVKQGQDNFGQILGNVIAQMSLLSRQEHAQQQNQRQGALV